MADASQDQQIYSDSSLRRFSLKLLRQFFRAGNWRSAIKNSELPEKAQATITALVEQTRLMRFEKSEIADELIAHFVDGLDRGNTCEELTSAFGDPEVAATLFRSSKLRRRPMAIKAGKATFWTALASGAGYLVLMAFFNAASPTPSVDYAALLNQKAAAVPESERAWLAYRDAWTKFKFSEGGSGSHFTEIFQKDEAGKQTSELIRPEDQGWAEAVEKLKASAELLDAFRAGAQLEHLGLAFHADLSKYSEKDFKALFPQMRTGTQWGPTHWEKMQID